MTNENISCRHDYEHPVKHGRATWLCKLCGHDISLVILLIAEVEILKRESILNEMVKENREMGLYDKTKI